MSAAHILYISGTLLVGIVIGYVLGSRAARDEQSRQSERAKR